MARPMRLAAWKRAWIVAWRPGLTPKELLDSTPKKRGRTAQKQGWDRQEGSSVDGWRREQLGREAQGHSEDVGLLWGAWEARPPHGGLYNPLPVPAHKTVCLDGEVLQGGRQQPGLPRLPTHQPAPGARSTRALRHGPTSRADGGGGAPL